MIQLDVDTREEEGWQEEVRYLTTAKWGPEKYKLYLQWKTWSDAEAHCREEGGHLASVLSEEEQDEVKTAIGGESYTWIGATKEEAVWRWSDGSPWGYHKWDVEMGNTGDERNCVFISRNQGYTWWDYSCTDTNPFLCQSPLSEF